MFALAWRMRNPRPAALISALAVALSGTAHSSVEGDRMEVVFCTTKYFSLTRMPKLARDYVADAKTVVPDAVRKCSGTTLRYQPATDGAAVVAFSTTRSEHETARCIKKVLPQVDVRSANSVEIPCPKPKDGDVCHLTQFWP